MSNTKGLFKITLLSEADAESFVAHWREHPHVDNLLMNGNSVAFQYDSAQGDIYTALETIRNDKRVDRVQLSF